MQCCTTNDKHYNVYLFFSKNIILWNQMQNHRENMKQKAKSFGSTVLFPYNFNVTLMLI